MFCAKCGAQNADGAVFCASCGASLSTGAQAAPSSPAPGGQAMPQSNQYAGKSPIVAAVLNLFFGLGYLYLGTKKVLGLSTILFVVVALVLQILLGIFTIGILSFVFAILLAVDGWQKANGGKGYINAE
ncbi:MAG TPA: zinc ribbon domain-containing protein [Nitrososphaerales archaeon]|nr:zinc ribbon domain-containing protein [Nitrososphaerales archaeon]